MSDDWLSDFSDKTRKVEGNRPLLLDDADTVWIIRSGSLALFAVSVESGEPVGARRPLFSVHAGEALFGLRLNADKCRAMIAIPLEETALSEISTESFARLAILGDARAAEMLSGWVRKLNLALDGTAILPTPETSDAAALSESIAGIHRRFLQQIDRLEQRDAQERALGLRDREQLFEHATQETLAKLAGAVKPARQRPAPPAGIPLYTAAHAVGSAAGIEVLPPKRSGPDRNAGDTLRAIERSSRFRTRRVLLTGKWWRQDCGPLLAFKLEDGHPVALLPQGPRRYALFDPAVGTRTAVRGPIASSLQPFAYAFYRPFPDKVRKPIDILAFGLKNTRRDVVAIVLAAISAALLGMFTPVATSVLIDAAIPDSNRLLLMQLGAGLLGAAFGKAFFSLSQSFATARVTNLSIAATQSAVWDRLLKLRPSFLRRYSTGDLSSRAMAISTIHRRLSTTTLQTLFSGFVSLLNLGLMFYYSSRLALIGIVSGLVIGLATLASGSVMLRAIRPLQQMGGKIMGLTVQLINGVSKLRVSGAERFAFAYWGKQYGTEQQLGVSVQRLQDQVGSLNQTIPMLATTWIFLTAGTAFVEPMTTGISGMSIGMFLAFNSAFGAFVGGISSLSDTIVNTLDDFSLWKRAEPILSAEPESDPGKTDPGVLAGRIEVDHVTFRYRDSGPWTLEDVTFRAEPGEFVAFVGPSGSGKSTIFRLLLGFDLPQTGTIFYDGQDLNGVDVFAVRRQLGVVLQNSNLLAGSIFENIGAGATITLDQAWEAARQAGIADDIASFPMGMHTFIAEGSSNISVGQRQRLLIARALVFHPRILLFDEATSALDNQAQAIVSDSLARLKVTRIVIAHRLSTIRNADRIYVIEGGRIVQQGTFDEMAQKEGIFSRMMSRQML